jgi:hypothetical protein
MATFINGVFLASSNGASASTMEMPCSERYKKVRVAIMQAAEHLWPKLFELGFIGQQQQPMQET